MSGIVGSSHNIRGSGVVAKLGTDGQVFTSAGAGIKQTYEDAASGSLVKIYSQTVSSAVAAVVFDNNYITSTYDNYKLVCYGMSSASDNQDIGMKFSVDNGSAFATHVGQFNYSQLDATTENVTGSSVAFGYIPFGSDEEADADGGTNAEMIIFNVNGTTQYTFCMGLGTAVNQGGNYYGYRIGGYIASNTAVNYLKVYCNEGGNVDAGTCTLYGFEK